MPDPIVRRAALLAALVTLVACRDEPWPARSVAPQQAPTGAAHAVPATAWAPDAAYSEARLSPFDPVK